MHVPVFGSSVDAPHVVLHVSSSRGVEVAVPMSAWGLVSHCSQNKKVFGCVRELFSSKYKTAGA